MGEGLTEMDVRAVIAGIIAPLIQRIKDIESLNIAVQFEGYNKWLMEEDDKVIALAGNPIQITQQEWNIRLMDIKRVRKELTILVERGEKAVAELKGLAPAGPSTEGGQ